MQDMDSGTMEFDSSERGDFSENDVFFECPRCDKSMGISKEGIGMVVTCPDCSLNIVVPSPGENVEYAGPDDQVFKQESAPAADEDTGYHLSRAHRDLLFDGIADIQRALDRLVASLDSLD